MLFRSWQEFQQLQQQTEQQLRELSGKRAASQEQLPIVGTSGNWGRLKSGAGWICLDYTSWAGSAKASSAKAADIDAMARAVIRGDYGNGEELRCRLGEKYAAVQRHVNELLK